MIDSLTDRRSSVSFRSRWSGAAFLVEAMLLLVFMAVSLVVLTQMFAASAERAAQSGQLAQAVAAASNAAEGFSAHPHEGVREYVDAGMIVVVESESDQREGGTLYRANITVYPISGSFGSGASATGASKEASEDDARSNSILRTVAGADPVYTLTTSVYESGVGRNG